MTQAPHDSSRPARRVALTLLAHPDDAEILCAGTLIRLHQQHCFEVHIATATAGDCGTTNRTPDEIMAIRTAEARDAVGATLRAEGLPQLGDWLRKAAAADETWRATGHFIAISIVGERVAVMQH